MDDRQKQARTVIDELHALMHTAEKSNPNGDITYLDVTRIIGRIREHFPDGIPELVKEAIGKGQELCSLKQINACNLRNRLIGLVLIGVGAIMTIVNAIMVKAPPAPESGFAKIGGWIKHLFVPPPPQNIDLGHPIGMFVGVALVVCGVYFLRKRAQQKEQALSAEAILREAIENWGNSTSITKY